MRQRRRASSRRRFANRRMHAALQCPQCPRSRARPLPLSSSSSVLSRELCLNAGLSACACMSSVRYLSAVRCAMCDAPSLQIFFTLGFRFWNVLICKRKSLTLPPTLLYIEPMRTPLQAICDREGQEDTPSHLRVLPERRMHAALVASNTHRIPSLARPLPLSSSVLSRELCVAMLDIVRMYYLGVQRCDPHVRCTCACTCACTCGVCPVSDALRVMPPPCKYSGMY